MALNCSKSVRQNALFRIILTRSVKPIVCTAATVTRPARLTQLLRRTPVPSLDVLIATHKPKHSIKFIDRQLIENYNSAEPSSA